MELAMAIDRIPLSEAPDLDDLNGESADGLLIWLLKPYVWLHGLVTLPFRHRRTSPPSHDVVTFPQIVDVGELYEIHRQRKSRAMRAGRVPQAVGHCLSISSPGPTRGVVHACSPAMLDSVVSGGIQSRSTKRSEER